MKILIVTGAGISANAGLLTYRGPNGVYTNTDFNIEEFLTFRNYKENTAEVSAYMKGLHEMFTGVGPSTWHTALVELEKEHEVMIATQNIDGLHQMAGSTNVIEIHGNAHETVIREGLETPNIVFFGDNLDFGKFVKIYNFMKDADVSVVIGSSMQFNYIHQLGLSGRISVLVDTDVDHPYKMSFDRFFTDIGEFMEWVKQKSLG